ncbi:IS630 family transposase [Hymenobacter baengnokdamensis]|uniref:IS630 family transposase n=1 Tax=Hymenobacter baengnokdamensis TaxID=2615203 RepID=UPI001246C687|nr:IS630 family transposase [Hymenobacter baengnokdamensis]
MQVSLTDPERQRLRALQKQRRDDEGYVKVTVVLLLDKGRSAGSIADDLGLDDGTVYRYAEAFARLGLEKYLAHEQRGYWGLLTSTQLAGLCQELRRTLYTDCRPLQAWLTQATGVRYSVSGLTDLLHRLGFVYKLTTPMPCEADADAQAAFLANRLQPLLERAAAGDAVVYFADAAHPTHNTRCTRAWTEKGAQRPLPTVSGRERVNLNAALNAHCPTQVYVHETACVNAQSTKALYEQLLAAHPSQPIYVVCDNARYYKNQELTQWLADKPLVQVFLPPYSPNLNLIERLWKFLRQKIINATFYRTKGHFRQAVLGFFSRLNEFGQELASLLTLNFHLLDSQPTS